MSSITFTVYKKELRMHLYSLSSYLFIGVFLVAVIWAFMQDFFLVNESSLRDFFSLLQWFFLLFLPALTMRIWTEERKSGTIETLLTLPISYTQAVIAKYAAAVTMLTAALALSAPLVVTLLAIGELDWGATFTGYVGVWLLGAASIAIGQWLSALTTNQIVAFIITVLVLGVFTLLGLSFFTRTVGFAADLFHSLSTVAHIDAFSKGLIDLRDVVYFLSLIVVALYLNVIAIKHK